MGPPRPRRLPPLPSIADIIQLYGLSARSQMSQNFLMDMNVTDKIVRLSRKKLEDCCVYEVGPGPGSLTRSILNAGVKKVIAVEKDRRFLPSLELLSDASDDRLATYQGDVLKFDVEEVFSPLVQPKLWKEEPPGLHIIGNLPFNVSIPLLLQWLALIPQRRGPFLFGRTGMTLTFQKEVAERITAPPGHKQRSRLSVMVQHLCEAKWAYTLNGACFVPKPKIHAVVLNITPLVEPVIDGDHRNIERVVKCLFQYRRKYIKAGARLLFPEDRSDLVTKLFAESGVDETLRAQQLTLEQWGLLSSTFTKLTQSEQLT